MSQAQTYTVEEARRLLPRVRRLMEEMQSLVRGLPELDAERAVARYRLGHAEGASERQHADGELRELDSAKQGREIQLARVVAELTSLDLRIKDIDAGLVDFLSYRDGELVELCWKLGEEDLGYWHRIGEGFAGRQPL
jgi:hypothetical protein